MRVRQDVAEVVSALFEVALDVQLSVPEAQFGDFATNVAMQLAGRLGKSPKEIAEQVVGKLTEKGYEASIAGPGFINIVVSDELLLNEAAQREVKLYDGESVVVEYSCPNYFKEVHTGHLYQTLVGDVLARLIERAGALVHRTNFGADVGLSAARAVWGILEYLGGEFPEKLDQIPAEKRTEFIARRYVAGASADTDETDVAASEAIKTVNKQIYEMHASGDTSSAFAQVYFTCREWCREYFLALYNEFQVDEFEKYYPESATESTGVAAVRMGLEKGVFVQSDGAVVFAGEAFDLHTRVFITSAGLPTYETKDIGVILLERQDFAFDKRILMTGTDQLVYMKVVWKALEQLQPGIEAKMTHLTNGTIRFGDGKKMSSRLGNVTRAVDVLETVREIVGRSEDTERDERIVLGAIKYEFLKYKLGGDIAFDPEESVSLQGNSGPYLQYALVRARSILAKKSTESTEAPGSLEADERRLVRKLSEYRSVIEKATREYLPHYICTYLYELAQEFNRFYEHNHVLGSERETIRLGLVGMYATTLEHGLQLLGIHAPEKM